RFTRILRHRRRNFDESVFHLYSSVATSGIPGQRLEAWYTNFSSPLFRFLLRSTLLGWWQCLWVWPGTLRANSGTGKAALGSSRRSPFRLVLYFSGKLFLPRSELPWRIFRSRVV